MRPNSLDWREEDIAVDGIASDLAYHVSDQKGKGGEQFEGKKSTTYVS